MKQFFAIFVMTLFASNAFADDWRMRKYDLDRDGFITMEELKLQCSVKPSLFRHADKNGDGKLSKKEARDATWILFKNHKCPKSKAIRG